MRRLRTYHNKRDNICDHVDLIYCTNSIVSKQQNDLPLKNYNTNQNNHLYKILDEKNIIYGYILERGLDQIVKL